MLAPALLQKIYATLLAVNAAIALVVGIRNFPRFAAWFTSKKNLIAQLFSTRAELVTVSKAKDLAHQAALDLQMSVDAVRSTNEDLLDRMKALEAKQEVNDSAIGWIPLILEYVVWIETIAKNNNVSLGDRQMPALPKIVIDYLRKNGQIA